MSILIKALKQAERDHLARAAAAATPGASAAVLEVVEPADEAPRPALSARAAELPRAPASTSRGGEALTLEPVDTQERGMPAALSTPHDSAREAAQMAAAATRASEDSPEDTAPSGSVYSADDGGYDGSNDGSNASINGGGNDSGAAAAAAPADRRASASADSDAASTTAAAPAPRVQPAVLQTTEPVPAPTARRASAPTAIPPMSEPAAAPVRPAPPRAGVEPRGRVTAGTAPADSTPASAEPQSQQRQAARQLMAPAPAGARRRLGIGLALLVLLLGGAALAYWQGLFSAIDGLMPDASHGPAQKPLSLAEHLQQLPAPGAVHAGKAGGRLAGPVPPGTAKPANTGPSPDSGTAATTHASAGSPKVAAESPRASDAIHLRAPEASPEHIRALLQQAYAAAGQGDTAGATALYQQVTELDHNNGDAWIGLAALAANSGDAAGAGRYYRRALEIDPGDSVALGGLLGMQDNIDPQEAETRLRLLIVRDGSQPALQAALGKMLARQGRWLEAQETFYRAWVADPSQADIAFNLAVSLERIRQPGPALSFYRRALELAQDHSARFDPAVAQERVTALAPKKP